MSSRRRRPGRSRGLRRQQRALWALAALLIGGLIVSRQWLAQQAALENASQVAQSRSATQLPPLPAEEAKPEPVRIVVNEPELLPKPADGDQEQVWRSGDTTHLSLPADWTTPTRYVNPDPELISLLHQAGLEPQVLRRSGDLRVRRSWQGGRSQVAVVESVTRRFSGADWRTIYAISHRDAGADAQLATRLAQANGATVLSHWGWDRGYWFARVLVPADANSDALISAVEHVLASADDLEQELSGATDEF